VVFDLDEFPEDNPPEVGQQYQVRLENGRVILAIATEVSESSVTFENTHRLAGEDLTFEITLVEILTSTPTPTPTTTPTETPNSP
jgi:FKBP-type peptidyl-prolyl cis-trans isomerase 2